MRKYDRMSALFWFIFGLYITREGYIMFLGTLKEPGPGFLLFWSGVILSGLSVYTFVRAHLAKEEESTKIWAGLKWYKPLLVLMISSVYALFFENLGFLLSTFSLMFLIFKFGGSLKWSKAIIASFLSTFCSWIIFDVWLGIQFSKGFLEDLIIYTLKMRH